MSTHLRPSWTAAAAAICLALFMLSIVPALSVSAQAADNGVVRGTVVNATTGQPMPNLTVTLSQFADQSGMNSVDTTTTTGADGSFEFTEQDTSAGLAYAVSARYAHVLYQTMMILLSREPEQDVELTVYEPTTDTSEISVATRGFILSGIEQEVGTVLVTDATTFRNASNATLVEGADGYSVRFVVPGNVRNVTPRAGFDFSNARIEEDAVLVTTPIKPGETQAGLDYQFHYTADNLDIPISIDYPTEVFQLLVPVDPDGNEPDINVTNTPLIDGGVIPIGERQFHVWLARDLQPGDTFTLRVSGLPRPPTLPPLNTIVPASLAALALAAGIAFIWFTMRRRKLEVLEPVVFSEIDEITYQERRAQLIDELRELEAQRENFSEQENFDQLRRGILEDIRTLSRQATGRAEDRN